MDHAGALIWVIIVTFGALFGYLVVLERKIDNLARLIKEQKP